MKSENSDKQSQREQVTLLNKNQEWLMKGVDQLLYEMKEFGHEYNVQVQSRQASDEKNQQSLAHDLAILRADHTIMAEQQRNLIQLIHKFIAQINQRAKEDQRQQQLPKEQGASDEEKTDQQVTIAWNNDSNSNNNELIHGRKSYLHRRLGKLRRHIRHNNHNSHNLVLRLHKLCRMTSEEEDAGDEE